MASSWLLVLLALSCCVYGRQKFECTKWIVKEEKSPQETEKDRINCSFHEENNTINVETPISCLNSSELAELTKTRHFHHAVKLSFSSNNSLYTIELKKKDNDEESERRDCWCRFCKNKAVKCRTCSPTSGHHRNAQLWDKLTFILVIVLIVGGIFLFLFVIFRKKIVKIWKSNNDSTVATRKPCTDMTGEMALGRFGYTADLGSNSGTYSLPRTEIEGRCYRPLRQSMTNTTDPHFQLQPFIHRPFEDENEDETYTKIIDEDMDCDPGHQTHPDAISHQVCGVTPSFRDSDGEDYNRLCHQSKRDEPTDCVPDAEENYHHFRCPARSPEARLSDGYDLAKTVTDAHVCFMKDKETPAYDNSSNDHISQDNNANTVRNDISLDDTSDEQTPHDDSQDNNTPHHPTFHDYAVSKEASHDSPSYESDSHENYSPRHTLDDNTSRHKATPAPTPLDNLADDKHPGEVSNISPRLHQENISAFITANNNDNIREPLQQAVKSQPSYPGN